MEFNEQVIRRSFDLKTFQRGLTQIYQQRKVGEIELVKQLNNLGLLRANVRGSGGLSYWTELEVFHNKKGITFYSDCDCPVGQDCKHGVAVALELLHNSRYAAMREKLGLKTAAAISKTPKTVNSPEHSKKFTEWLHNLQRNIHGGAILYGEPIDRWFRFRLF